MVWEPPRRLVLAWQINGQWQYDPEFVTEVEVRFSEDAGNPQSTQVELEHRNLNRYGEEAEQLRATFDSPQGWAGELARFAAAVDA
jgi:uncharacterized protein YndB with AHSA1/START domain